MQNLLELLPRESFVPFEARRLAKARSLWVNKELFGSRRLEDFYYCIPYPEEPNDAYSEERILLQAERYGGAGLAGNGGGVRCGILGSVQLKGIGQNPLAGVTTDHWHKHGAASIQDCVREAIWGEILNSALPYGAVRALGVISTGTEFAVEVADTKLPGTAPRGLVARDSALRPAHYMRSVFFSPSLEMNMWCNDPARTKAAVSAFVHGVCSLRQPESHSAEFSPEDLNIGLSEIFRRAASQIAASRAKRIIHGSLISSNFALDGRWLDFGTVTALAGHGRAIVAPGSLDLWSQQASVIETIHDLHFYLSKYLASDWRLQLVSREELTENFLEHFRVRLQVEFLKLTGLPEAQLHQLDNNCRQTLWRIILHFVTCDSDTPYLYYGDDRHGMPLQSGRYATTEIMRACAVSASPEQLKAELRHSVSDHTLLEEFANAYWSARRQIIATVDPCFRENTRIGIAINGLRSNWNLQGLYRREFDGEVDKVRKYPDEVGAYIDSTVKYWSSVLADNSEPICLQPWISSRQLHLSEKLVVTDDAGPLTPLDFDNLIGSLKLSDTERCALRNSVRSAMTEN